MSLRLAISMVVLLSTSACSMFFVEQPSRRTRLDTPSCSTGALGVVDAIVGAVVLVSARAIADPLEYATDPNTSARDTVVAAPIAIGVGYLLSSVYGISAPNVCLGDNVAAVRLRADFVRTIEAIERGDCAQAIETSVAVKREDPAAYAYLFGRNQQLQACVQRPPQRTTVETRPPQPPPLVPSVEVDREAQMRVFEACRLRRIELMQEAYKIVDLKERGEFLLSIPRCVRPSD